MPELTLFVSAFLAATILPFSSEIALVFAIKNGMPELNALFFASVGNVLAVVFNYFLGYFLYKKSKKKLLKSKIGKKVYICGHRYGYVAMLFSFLPVVGDPLSIVAGLFRLRFLWFILLVGSLRVLRYVFVIQLL